MVSVSIIYIMEKVVRIFMLILISSTLIVGFRVIKKKQDISYSTFSRDFSPSNSYYGTRGGRFLNPFSLFSVVSFDNTDCTTSSGTLGDIQDFHHS